MCCSKSVILESKDCSHRCLQVYKFIFQASHYRNQQNLENAFKEVINMESVQDNFAFPHTTRILKGHMSQINMAVRAVKRAEVEHPHGMFKWVSSDCLSCNSIITIASLRLFVIVGTWWQLCYPNETLRGHTGCPKKRTFLKRDELNL